MTINVIAIGQGMITPVGVGALATAAAARAGINRYVNSPAEGMNGEPIKMAMVPDECLPEIEFKDTRAQLALYQRMLKLGVVALTEAVESLSPEKQLKEAIPVFLALPEQRCGQAFPALEPILKDLSNAVECHIDLLTSRVFPVGRAAGFRALAEAYQLLENTHLERVIVGGIDSYFDLDLLKLLDSEKRMLGDNSVDGFVPGEGAAFLILEKIALEKTGQDAKGLSIQAPSVGNENGHFYSEEPCLGNGLTSAISGAVESAKLLSPIQTVLCSVNGESLQVKEWSIALTRNTQAFSQGFNVEHPAECYGDLGAATVPTLLGLSLTGISKGYLSTPLLVWGASDNECRGAVIISNNQTAVQGA